MRRIVLAIGPLVAVVFACVGSDPDSTSVPPGNDGGGSSSGAASSSGGSSGTSGDAALVCTAPEKDCSGVCVNVDTSGDHCGGCGHSCGGGACLAGKCQPALVVDGTAPVRGLDLTATTVVYTLADRVLSCALAKVCDATNQPTGLGTGFNKGGPMFVSGANVFFGGEKAVSDDNDVWRCPLPGGCGADLEMAPAELVEYQANDDVVMLAKSPTRGAWARDNLGKINLRACTLSDCKNTVVIVKGDTSDETGLVLALAVSDSKIFYSTALTSGGHGLRVVNIAAGQTPTFASTDSDMVVALAHSTGKVYGASFNAGLGKIFAVADTGGAPTTLANYDMGPATSITVASDTVFWTNATTGTVNQCPTSGCAGGVPIVLASAQAGAGNVQVSGGFVYWSKGNQILRVAQ